MHTFRINALHIEKATKKTKLNVYKIDLINNLITLSTDSPQQEGNKRGGGSSSLTLQKFKA